MASHKSLKIARQDLECKIETAKGQLLDAISNETLQAHSEWLNSAITKLTDVREDTLSLGNVTPQEEDPTRWVTRASNNLTPDEGVAASGSSSDDGSTASIHPVLREKLEVVESTLTKADEFISRIEAWIVQAQLPPSCKYSDSYGHLPELSLPQLMEICCVGSIFGHVSMMLFTQSITYVTLPSSNIYCKRFKVNHVEFWMH